MLPKQSGPDWRTGVLQRTSGGDKTNGAAVRKDGVMKGTPMMRDTATTEGNKANRKTVIRVLNEALATEIICILRYKRHYFMTAGISS